MADWRFSAACVGEDSELFFPIGVTGPAVLQIEEARAVCRRCPVRETCLRWALDTGQDAGIWGGLTEDERRALKRRNARAGRSASAGLSPAGGVRRPDFGAERPPLPGYTAAAPVAVVIEFAQSVGCTAGEIQERLQLTADAVRAVRTEKLKTVRQQVADLAAAWIAELQPSSVKA